MLWFLALHSNQNTFAMENQTVQSAQALQTDGEFISITYGGISFNTYWWGIDIILSEDHTKNLIKTEGYAKIFAPVFASALMAGGLVSGSVSEATSGAFTAAFLVKANQIESADEGEGVHWPITWLQWAGMASAVPIGKPLGVTSAALFFIHPFANNSNAFTTSPGWQWNSLNAPTPPSPIILTMGASMVGGLTDVFGMGADNNLYSCENSANGWNWSQIDGCDNPAIIPPMGTEMLGGYTTVEFA